MSIRSIDMQVLIQKVGEVAKVQQTHQLESSNRQQESAQQIGQQTQIDAKTVSQPLRNEHTNVHEKQEKENKEKKSRTKKGKSNKTENKENNEKDGNKQGNHLDVTI
ncbi:MAG: hypothetical protein PHE26_02465 [Syntrophomonadaceae bacterium]|nr:hypothetical protein [Syntrophomonadaceae bacterium]